MPTKEENFDSKLENYENLSVLEVMQLAVETDDKGREKLLRKEEKGQSRQPVVDILKVNWNS